MLAHSRALPAARGAFLALLIAIASCLAPSPLRAQAQWAANGVPVCVIPGCSGRLPQVCGDGSGGALVAWNRNPTQTDQNIYVHRVLSSGLLAPSWPPKGTPATRAPADQWLTDIVADGQGGAFVVWFDFPNYDVYAQHVLGNGQIAPGWPVDGLPVGVAPRTQWEARLLPDGAGGVFVAWDDERAGDFQEDVYVQHLMADGSRVPGWPENGLGVSTAPERQIVPVLGSDGQGGCFVVWTDSRNGIGGEIFAQRVSWFGEIAAGWPPDGKQIISGYGVYAGRHIWGVVPDETGGAYIGWGVSHGPFAYDDDVFAIRILEDGSTAPGWPAAGFPVCALNNTQYLTSVVSDGVGGVLLAWYDNRTNPGVAYVQRLRPDGTPAPGWQQNGNRVSDLPGYHFAPRASPDGQGGVYVAFQEAFYATGHMQHMTGSGILAPGWPSPGLPIVNDPTGSWSQQDFQVTSDGVGGAVVTWDDARNETQNQIYAQRYFGGGPTPVLVSLVSVEALTDRVALTWHDPSRAVSEATVYRRREGEDWAALGRASFDGTGRLRYEDRGVVPGERLAYRLGWMESGSDQFSAETWIDVPRSLAFALEGARPNPAVGPLSVAFTLPQAEAATLELLDVAGRQVVAREVGGLGPGAHVIRLGECGCTPPGMYWVRLTQSGRSLLKRAVVVK